MKVDHLANVHTVDMVRPKHRHDIRFELLDEVQVLIDGVSRALVPALPDTHLRRDGGNKILIRRQTTKPPTSL